MITAENVTVEFRRTARAKLRALDRLTLTIPRGEFFALLGENGAGKSTAMYCFLGLLRPTSGTILIDGQPPVLGSKTFERIAYLPEEPHYPDYLTIDEAIDYYSALFGPNITRHRRADILERLGLAPFRTLRIGKCSKGMKQKVGIAQCLINEPDVLFLDEPMRGLDPAGVHDFRDILVEMHHRGATIVMNSHILAEVEMVASRVAILHRGRLVVDGDVNALTRVDGERYDVVWERAAPPPFVADVTPEGERFRGSVSKDELAALVTYLRDADGVLVSSELKRISLEERFLSIVREERAHA